MRAFVPAAQREGKSVAVVRVQDGDGKVHLYGRQEGLWRCLDYRCAPALGDRIEQLISGLYEAQGVVLSEHPQQPQDYGLDVPSMRTISLHGAGWTSRIRPAIWWWPSTWGGGWGPTAAARVHGGAI